MERSAMIQVIVDDLEAWLERDAYSFWDHKDLQELYEEAAA